METIEIIVVENNGRVIDLVEKEEWDELDGDVNYPEEKDWTEPITVPKKEWDDGDIGFRNYKKFIQ